MVIRINDANYQVKWSANCSTLMTTNRNLGGFMQKELTNLRGFQRSVYIHTNGVSANKERISKWCYRTGVNDTRENSQDGNVRKIVYQAI